MNYIINLAYPYLHGEENADNLIKFLKSLGIEAEAFYDWDPSVFYYIEAKSNFNEDELKKIMYDANRYLDIDFKVFSVTKRNR